MLYEIEKEIIENFLTCFKTYIDRQDWNGLFRICDSEEGFEALKNYYKEKTSDYIYAESFFSDDYIIERSLGIGSDYDSDDVID